GWGVWGAGSAGGGGRGGGAVARAGRAGARPEEADARAALGGPLVQLGDPDAGLAELEAAVRLAAQADNPVVVLRAILTRSDVLLATGRLDEAAAVPLDGLPQAPRPGLAPFACPVLARNPTEPPTALVPLDHP